MILTDTCIRNPTLAWMLMAAIVLAGLVSLSRIGISQFPDIDKPMVSVRVTWEGASPAAIESDVVELLEEALTQVEGIRAIRSTARQGQADITLELDLSRNVDLALQDAQARVSQTLRKLPKDLDPPVLSKSNPDDQPILWLALSGAAPPAVLADYARYRVKEKLQTVAGVGEITLGGFQERNVRVWLDQAALDSRGLTVAEVVAALRREHVEMPAGQLISGGREVNVRVLGEALDLATLRALTVTQRGGTPVRLDEVALIEDGFEDVRSLARLDGRPALGLGVRKQRGANAVAVADGVYRALAQLRQEMPAGLELQVNNDSTRFIRDSVHEIEWELGLAILLTGVLCWFFLGSLSSTLNVILAIPMSLLGTVAVLYFAGYTLNTFTLLGLGLAVGLVVDDAIMVLENITRHREEGADQIAAARIGTREIAFAALASSVAIVAVFSPVLFMAGEIGRFLLQFGIALCVAILLSYLEAVTLAPARCAQFLAVGGERRTWLGRLADGMFAVLERVYRRVLRGVLGHPWLVLAAGGILFAISLKIVLGLKTEMVPSQDQDVFRIRFETAVGSSLADTDAKLKQAEARLLARSDVVRCFAAIGMGGGGNVNSGMMFVTLIPQGQRPPLSAVMNEIRKDINTIPGFEARPQDLSAQAFTSQRGNPVEVSLRGSDWAELQQQGANLRQRMRDSDLFADVDTDVRLGMPELRLLPDRARCSDLGIPVQDVADAINALVGGIKAGKFSDGSRRLDLRVRLLANQRSRPEDLARVQLRTAAGDLVPLSSLVTTSEIPVQQEIRRADRERAVGIFANLGKATQGDALAQLEEWARELPASTRLVFTGASQTFRESNSGLLFAFIGGLLAAYMVLAAQFNSFLHPLNVMIPVLPLSISGAAITLYGANQTLNLFSGIGILLLLGIAKKNSIILVDYTNQLRQPPHSLTDARTALERAGPIRLRPILMTSLATMAAAIPMALGLGPGGEIRRPMALAVLGGVALSTILSLLVVPAFYLATEQLRQFCFRKRREQ